MVARLLPPAGTEVQETVDADEDREIVGYEVVASAETNGDGVTAEWELFVGSDPALEQADADTIRDFGGKFVAHGKQQGIDDTTNGVGRTEGSTSSTMVVPRGEGWQWNEDQTLTIQARETFLGNDADVQVTVHYFDR